MPEAGTEQLLADLGILYRRNPSGFSLIGEIKEGTASPPEIRTAPDKPTRLVFLLKQANPFFLNFTDLPFHAFGDSVYYFNNLQSNVSDGTHYLHTPGSPENKVTDSDRMPVRNGLYRYTFAGSNPEKTARLKFIDLDLEAVQRVPITEEGFLFQYDLGALPMGRAELWIDGNKEDAFFAANIRDLSSVFGLVELYHSDAVPAAYRFIKDDGTVQQQAYKLAFHNRNTKWRYLVVDRTGANLVDPGIEGEGFTFSREAGSGYPDNYLVFLSDQHIPFKEVGFENLTLKKKISTASRNVMEHLPNPNVRSLKQDGSGTDYISEVYLYI
ncbi:MAG: hypothetical protein R3211_05245 [Balneolaceae bacterium]|nr:hypothetical protein [Balneolaceae bacterium]